jgi:hypothetical protein
MAIVCGHCGKALEFSGDPPTYCAYCGVRLNTARSAETPTAAASTVAYRDPRARPGAEPPAVPPPAEIGGYRLGRVLGSGGMGTVYEAVGAATGQRVAVKLLGSQFAAHSTSLERFRQEGQLASLIAHPRCVFVLAADEEAGRPYIVMELMPGETLKDLVERRGPLPPQEAVAKILDVIDGLREAHRLGILHRDVKPSNCFLMPDGRVKVGDFGLSKSLTGDTSLTQTGTFLGTVLYASPEQVRGEGIDYAADVYSVCATLYFLLTGRAPFQHENPGAVLAKVVSEDPPPIRLGRPAVSRRLERVVMRGLERDKARRWQSLDDLRAALAALLPGTATRGGLGLRFAAYLIDVIILFGATTVWAVLVGLTVGFGRVAEEHVPALNASTEWVGLVLELAYFALMESVWGASLGKFCFRLRVCPAGGTGPPPWPRVVVRTALFVTAVHLFAIADQALDVPPLPAAALWAAAMFALLGPMRRRTGYRGLHEWASGTRVVQLPWALRRRPLRPVRARFAPDPLSPGRYPAEVGPYRVRGVVFEDEREAVLLADDPSLGRTVHLWLRPADAAPLPPARRSLSRPTRPRWLWSGTADGRQWDAFFAPEAAPLADLATPDKPLNWTETRPILEQLADEFHDARADGTLPAALSVDRIWVLPDGRVQLLDFGPNPQHGWLPDEAGVLLLLHEAAELALEGQSRPPGAPPDSINMPVPRHAVALIDRLLSGRQPFRSLEEFRAELLEAHGRPTDTTRALRGAHLGVQAIFLAVGVVWMFAFSGLFGLVELTATLLHIDRGRAALAMYRDPAEASDRLRPVLQRYDADGLLGDRLERQLNADRAHLVQRLRGANLAEQVLFRLGGGDQAEASEPEEIGRKSFTEVAERATVGVEGLRETRPKPYAARLTYVRFRDFFTDYAWVAVAVLAFWPALWVAWAFLTRGGLTLALTGLALVLTDGRKAPRWRCAWRALLVWVPVVLPLVACVWVKVYAPHMRLAHTGLWWLAVAVLVGAVVLAVRRPQQAPHDRLAGTCLVPL